MILDQSVKGAEPALFAPVGEVSNDLCLGADARDDLDVEHHLALGPVLGCGGRAVNADRRDRRHGNANRVAEGLQVVREVSATELEDGRYLTLPVATGEVVVRCQFGRLVRRARHARQHPRGDRLMNRVPLAPRNAAIVKPEDTCDDPLQPGGQVHVADPTAVRAVLRFILEKPDLECLLHRRYCAREPDCSRRDTRVY